MGWDREEDTEENKTQKNNKHVICSKCTGSLDPMVEPIIIDVTPSSTISLMDITPGTTGKTTNGEEKDKDNGKEETQVSWKDCVENLVELDRESIKYGKFLTDTIIRVMIKCIQEWL